MWLRLLLLLIYFLVLFILARILETVAWGGTSNLSRRLLDPMTMSVLKLKALLEQRGISYEGAVEKQELSELVSSTGAVTGEELAESTLEETSEVTNFTSGSHFYEQVEDAKDSVWLVQVMYGKSQLSDKSWIAIRKKISKFGVHVGMFDCSLDLHFCHMRQWSSTHLLLGLPQNFETKAKVSLFTYSGSYKVHKVYNWVKSTVNKKVHPIRELETYKRDWLSYSPSTNWNSEVRVVMFTKYPSVPLFYSALSVKFPGRVKFGMVDVSTVKGKHIMKRNGYSSAPIYLIITAENIYNFGSKPADYITFRSMETFLKLLYPSLNDIFITTLVICNVLSWFEICIIQGSLIRRFIKFVWCIIKYNVILFLTWILLLAVFQLPIMEPLTNYGLKLLRLFGGIYFRLHIPTRFILLRNKCISIRIFISCVHFGCGYEGQVEETNPETNEWNFAQFQTLAHVFYPSYALPSYLRRGQNDIEGHLGIGLGNVSFNTSASKEYIKYLPTWKYHCVITQDVDVPRNEQFEDTKDGTDEASCSVVNTEVAAGNKPNTKNDAVTPSRNSNRMPLEFATGEDQANNSQESDSEPSRTSNSEPENCVTMDNKQKLDNNETYRSENHGAPEGFLECNQCVICLDNYRNGVVILGLPCGHCFHKSCVVLWLVRGNHYCPVCRWPSNRPKSEIHLHSE
ncbi:hypothetical protein KUTeg_005295 [Tegillarca granosa]|uniref:RING-type domain-containing protein n=1 Tax=Tegillarca granosa TaxID=220873 RepID=A0ABQ9FJC0_TEGGR|nr:hypothetical protein KUTeg_005295 [Tegillarca granosa]